LGFTDQNGITGSYNASRTFATGHLENGKPQQKLGS
jgi:hypothetical protein